jgi:hypothetical protein
MERVNYFLDQVRDFFIYPRVADVNMEWFRKYPVCPAVVDETSTKPQPLRRCGDGQFSKIVTLRSHDGKEIDLGCEKHPWKSLPQYRDYKQVYDVAKSLDETEFFGEYENLLKQMDAQISDWDNNTNEDQQRIFNIARVYLTNLKAHFVEVMGKFVQ